MENSVYLRSVPLSFGDHGNKLLKALYEQQKKSHLCDLLLIVENVSFPVHKCVLAAFSGYFYTLFDKGKQTDNAGSKACNVTTIHLSSTSLNAFIPVLHYLYTSKLHVFVENIRDVMRTARKLQIHSILNTCEKLLDDNTVLPSIHKAGEKQSSNTIVTQSNLSESVIYVDLRSDDEDKPNQSGLQENQRKLPSASTETQAFQQLDVSARMEKCSEKTPTGAKRLLGSSHGADIPSESPPIYNTKHKMARSQKKGFPRKVDVASEQQTSPTNFYNISATVAPASIFGRVSNSPTSRIRTSSSVTSPDPINKPAAPLDGTLEALDSIFGADSLVVEHTPPNVSSSVKIHEKAKTAGQPKSTAETIQLHSIFSMAQSSSHRATVTSGEWLRLQTSTGVVSAVQTASHIPPPILPNSLQTLSSTPSVYTCKECFKYFTNLSEAIHHFYSEHQSSSSSSSLTKAKPSTFHTCPHCNRVFNNKNNLKRHILIKHTTDKRFKCALCGRRYAIRQSLKYHMRSAHGVSDMRTAAATSSYQFEPDSESSSAIDTFSDSSTMVEVVCYPTPSEGCGAELGPNNRDFDEIDELSLPYFYYGLLRVAVDQMASRFSSPTVNTVSSLLESFQPITNSALLSPANFLTAPTENLDATARSEKHDSGMPMIENIRSVARDKEKLLNVQQHPANSEPSKPAKERKLEKVSSKKDSRGGNRELPTLLPHLSDDPNQEAADDPVSLEMPLEEIKASEVSLRLHRCDHCSRIFSTIHAYSRHKRTCHKHECPICHRGFSQLGNMRRHIKIFHCEQKPYECHICHKAYGIKQSFQYHMRDKHGTTDVNQS